jgi:hypothetical protein
MGRVCYAVKSYYVRPHKIKIPEDADNGTGMVPHLALVQHYYEDVPPGKWKQIRQHWHINMAQRPLRRGRQSVALEDGLK